MSATITGINEITRALQDVGKTLRTAIEAAGNEIAAKLQEYAKANHPWQNDTGNTEETTVAGITELTEAVMVVTLTTGTDYSVFLELCHDGKWAWLWPTMLACQDEIKDILERHLGTGASGNFGMAMRKQNP